MRMKDKCDDKRCLACHGTEEEIRAAEEDFLAALMALKLSLLPTLLAAQEALEKKYPAHPNAAMLLLAQASIQSGLAFVKCMPEPMRRDLTPVLLTEVAKALAGGEGHVEVVDMTDSAMADVDASLKIKVPGTLH